MNRSRTPAGKPFSGKDRKRRAAGRIEKACQSTKEFIIGGRNAVMEALAAGMATKIFVKPGKKDGRLLEILEAAKKASLPIGEADDEELFRMTGLARHQGVAACLRPFQYADLQEILRRNEGTNPFFILLDGIEDVRNLGAMVRTAECAGAAAVLLPKHKSPPVTAAAFKTSAGAFSYLPVCQTGNIRQTLEAMKKRGYWIAGADMEGESLFDGPDLTGPLVIVMGAEGKGLSPLTKTLCDFFVSIPMQGHVSSLNVSVAAALIMYEAARQRGEKNHA